MRQFLYLLTFFLLLSCGVSTTQAQNYKTHKVQQGETIEEIAKTYNVTPFDIYSLNPDAKKGLEVNSVLIIPNSRISTGNNTGATKELIGFKEHKTRRKETLYSISKAYNLEIDDIKKHNTFLYANNLRKGDKLKIPVYKTVKDNTTTPKEVATNNSKTRDYKVLPKEGKWRIAYKFGITIEELEALNPKMGSVLDEGQIIQVPNLALEDEKEIDHRYSYYTVQPKEGFYRLKVKLGLSQEELEKLNPELKESGLKNGMVLKVPYQASLQDGENSSVENQVNLTDSISFGTKRLAFMLPFQLNKIASDSIQDNKQQLTKNPFLKTSLDFYEGALVALDSLKTMGISLDVNVYDTKNQLSEVMQILRSEDLENTDAVIGPLMPNNLNKVASELKSSNTPVISPITKNVQLYENVFQSRPSEDLLRDKVVSYFQKDTTYTNIIIISDAKHTKVNNDLKATFPRASQVFSRKNKKGEEAYFVYDADITDKLKPGKNIVFLESDNPGLVSNVTSKLNAYTNVDGKTIVLATTSMNSAFENDNVSNYHLSNLNFHFPALAKSYDSENHNSFVKAYEKRFGITPNKIAVRGFDITMDVVLRLASYDDLYKSVNKAPLTEYVENKFAYKKKLFGGYYNDTVYLVKYDDLKVVEVQ
ncbi:PBP1 and LysM peptidoglycan-binding domain-containing protein [Mangrovimonas spongiae]|uniref:LysM peptidoglycan-binding domain-containing protein n=1 Tax=Mangrovimonas spongiae TaxID=2494697 RepID=A0A3R9M9N0_9FLAO|nr:LysM peptidoglycan-binding domain-containing protein [Mangrovimonas spongiae]RSK40552.1 LysM peptidoglycan-binding domain-containing protein [Mangrovimonas spongiae]